MLRVVGGFALLLSGALLAVFVGSLMPPSGAAAGLGLLSLALGAAGLRLLWRHKSVP